MTSPRKIFYWIALLSGIAALILNMAWHEQEDQILAHAAPRMEAAMKQNITYVRDAETIQVYNTLKILYHAGATLTVLACVAILVAIFRQEKGRYVIPLVIIVFAFGAFIIL